MSNVTSLIIDEVKTLISYSIQNTDNEKGKFESLHCEILKKYFDAKEIEINYLAQTIDLQLPMSNKNYTKITFECLDLNNFLQSCLKSDKDSLYFYQDLLSNYNNVVTAA